MIQVFPSMKSDEIFWVMLLVYAFSHVKRCSFCIEYSWHTFTLEGVNISINVLQCSCCLGRCWSMCAFISSA